MVLVEGQATDVTVTVTGGTDRLRCVVVSVPADFTVLAAQVVSVPGAETWRATVSGAAPTSVTFSYVSGGGGIQLLQTADFRIQAMAVTAPASAWTTTGYTGKTSKSTDAGPPLLPLQPFAIIPGPTPTPTSTATPTPTSTATPTPTSTATPTPTTDPTASPTAGTSPSPTPTAGRSPAPSPSPARSPSPNPTRSPQVSPTATVAASASPSPTAPAATPSPSGPPTGGAVSGTTGGGGSTDQAVSVGGPPAGSTVAIDDVGGLDALGFAWLVPGALLGLPSLLLVLIIGAQAGLAGVFVPLTGRTLAEPETRPGA